MFKLTQGEPSEQQVVIVVVVATLMVLYAFLLGTVALCGWLKNHFSDTGTADEAATAEPAAAPRLSATRGDRRAETVTRDAPAESAV